MKLSKRSKITTMLAILAISTTLVACSGDKSNQESNSGETSQEQGTVQTTKDDYTYDSNDYFTSLDWLEENKDKENLVILDGRSEKDYKKGHIPGAINVAWQSISKMDGKSGDKDWGTLKEAEELSKDLSKLGIDEDSIVITYGNKDGWGEDARLAWSLKRAGIDARVLNGGYDLWSSEDREITKEVNDEIKATDIALDKVSNDMNITTEELKKEYEDLVIIDTREIKEYEGATKHGEARGGHLPGAINIPFTELYNEDGTIKSNEEIEKVMKENNINKDSSIVTYCTAGIRSAHMQIALTNAGYENVRNYDASFYEWAGDESNELEK